MGLFRSLSHSRVSRMAVFLLGLLLPAACGFSEQISARAGISAIDIDGRSVSVVKPGDTSPVVLFFIASDCPISNRLIPEMQRVQTEFTPRGVRFRFVYPNLTETAKGIRAHLKAYGLEGTPLTDPDQRLAHLVGAQLTPEAAILVPGRSSIRTVYIGRIDNRYLSIGRERPQATEHDIEAAIAAILGGRQPNPPSGPPVGCGIVSFR